MTEIETEEIDALRKENGALKMTIVWLLLGLIVLMGIIRSIS